MDSDILDIADIDTNLYLSELHDQNKKKKLLSVVVKTESFAATKQSDGSIPRRVREIKHHRTTKFHSNQQQFQPKRTRGGHNGTTHRFFNQSRGHPINAHNHSEVISNNRHVFSDPPIHSIPPTFCVNLGTTPPNTVNTETRGTQTDRTGPCKCARSVQIKNKRRRLENKRNKKIIDSLAA